MFFDKLTQLLTSAFRPKPKYFTVTPVAGTGPVAALPPATMPRHVAIIMDGNGRWAKMRNLPRSAGHAAGTEALREIIRASDDWGIEALSIYAFSTENWARSKEEIDALMGLLLQYFASEIDELDAKNVRITILGDVDGLPGPQREAVCKAMDRTRNNDGLKLNIALNYGGRAELTRAARILARQVRDGVIDPEDIDEEMFAEELYTADSPDVDLLIRTSGEKRTSNFLPWQLTYAEFVFDDTYWPDFTRERYMRCLREYAGRERRFGREEVAPEASEAASPTGRTDEAAAGAAKDSVPLEVKPVVYEKEVSAPKADPDADDGKDENVTLEVKPVLFEKEKTSREAVAEADSAEDENVTLEVKPVIFEKDEPVAEADAPDESATDEAVTLEVKPVLAEAEESPAGADQAEEATAEVQPVVHEPEAPTSKPEEEQHVVLEVKPVLSRREEAPAAPKATLAASESDAAEEAVPEDFVLEIKPVISPKPQGATATSGDAPTSRPKKKRRSRKRRSAGDARPEPKNDAAPKE